jgi:hypothetical protein
MSDMLDAKDSSPEECMVCDVGLAVVGLVVAAVFLYISVDVLSSGRLTGLFTGGGVDV